MSPSPAAALLSALVGALPLPALSASDSPPAGVGTSAAQCERALTYEYRRPLDAQALDAVKECAQAKSLLPRAATLEWLGWRRIGFGRTPTAEFAVHIDGIRVLGAVVTLQRPDCDPRPRLEGPGSMRNARWRPPKLNRAAAMAAAVARHPDLTRVCGEPSSELAYRTQYEDGTAGVTPVATLVPEWRLIYCAANRTGEPPPYVTVNAITGVVSDVLPFAVPEMVDD